MWLRATAYVFTLYAIFVLTLKGLINRDNSYGGCAEIASKSCNFNAVIIAQSPQAFYGNRTELVRLLCGGCTFFGAIFSPKVVSLLHDHRTASERCPFGDCAMILRYVYGLTILKNLRLRSPWICTIIVRLWPPPHGIGVTGSLRTP